jgi:hypothetical protein
MPLVLEMRNNPLGIDWVVDESLRFWKFSPLKFGSLSKKWYICIRVRKDLIFERWNDYCQSLAFW